MTRPGPVDVSCWTDPAVFTTGVEAGWADPETDPRDIDMAARSAAAAIPYEVREGRPVSPFPGALVRRGRSQLGRWGENLMADALVTLTCAGSRHLLMIERADGYGWAVPGGAVEAGEAGLDAAVRELAEETGLAVPPAACRVLPARHVPDPRASGEAWAVTIPVHADLGRRAGLPGVLGADDARNAAWFPAVTFASLEAALARYRSRVFPAHADMLRGLLDGAR